MPADPTWRCCACPVPRCPKDAARQCFEAEAENWRLSPAHRGILQEMQCTPGTTVGEIAMRLEILPSICIFLIGDLNHSGFVREVSVEGGLPSSGFVLTDDGHSLLASIKAKTHSGRD